MTARSALDNEQAQLRPLLSPAQRLKLIHDHLRSLCKAGKATCSDLYELALIADVDGIPGYAPRSISTEGTVEERMQAH